jgi:hypothetical protein
MESNKPNKPNKKDKNDKNDKNIITAKDRCECLSSIYGYIHKKEDCALNKIFDNSKFIYYFLL